MRRVFILVLLILSAFLIACGGGGRGGGISGGSGSGGSGSVAGTTWTSRNSGTPLYAVTYGNNTFVAVGAYGTILTSTDGVSWTQRTSPTSNHLRAVTYGNNTFVAVGDYGTILTSP